MADLEKKETLGILTDLLPRITIFDTLDPNELKIIIPFMDVIEAKPGTMVFQEGDRGDYVCFVAEGTLDVLKTSEGGHHVAISCLNRGRSIGEMAILDHFPRSASVRARTRSTLITLSRDAFTQIMDQHPRIGIKIVRGIARLLSLSLRKTSSRLVDYMLPLG